MNKYLEKKILEPTMKLVQSSGADLDEFVHDFLHTKKVHLVFHMFFNEGYLINHC